MIRNLLMRRALVVAAALATATVPAITPVVPAAAIAVKLSPAIVSILRELRTVDVPDGSRRANWLGPRGEGSCVHASLINLLHAQGRHALADQWQAGHGDGTHFSELTAQLDSAGIAWAGTADGDPAFLEWAGRTRRGAVIPYGAAHAVSLIGFDARQATIMDPNAPDRPYTVPRDEFLAEWRRRGGNAVTPVGSPLPPRPWLVRRSS